MWFEPSKRNAWLDIRKVRTAGTTRINLATHSCIEREADLPALLASHVLQGRLASDCDRVPDPVPIQAVGREIWCQSGRDSLESSPRRANTVTSHADQLTGHFDIYFDMLLGMKLGLENAVIIVTGGASGIGAAVAELCSKEGAIPVIVDRDESAVTSLQQRLKDNSLRSEAVITDLTDFRASCAAVAGMAKKLGHIDGLVNNAGVNDGVGLEHGTPARFIASLDANLAHYFAMAKVALPFLIASKGAIVNIGSKVAITGQGGTSGYAASKGAIIGLTTQWADELAKHDVRVNVIIPAEVMTSQYQRWLKKFPDPLREERKIASKIPLGQRFTSPSEIASAVLFLLSSTNTLSGQEVFVDGGYVHLDRGLT